MVMSHESVAPLFRPILHVDLQIGKKHRTAWSVNALRRPAFTGGKIQIHIHVIRYADRYTNNWQPDKHKHVNTCILHHLSIKKQQHLWFLATGLTCDANENRNHRISKPFLRRRKLSMHVYRPMWLKLQLTLLRCYTTLWHLRHNIGISLLDYGIAWISRAAVVIEQYSEPFTRGLQHSSNARQSCSWAANTQHLSTSCRLWLVDIDLIL